MQRQWCFLFARLAVAATGFSVGPALAHTNVIGLEHFVTQSSSFVAVVTGVEETSALFAPRGAEVNQDQRTMQPLGVFELGRGRRVVVLTDAAEELLAPADGVVSRFAVGPGEILSFVESRGHVDGREVVTGEGRIRGLFVLTPKEHRRLAENPFNLVHAVPLVPKALTGQESIKTRAFSDEDREFFSGPYRRALEQVAAQSPNRTNPVNRDKLRSDLKVLSGESSFRDEQDGGKEQTIRDRGSEAGRDLTRRFLVQRFSALGAEAGLWCYKGTFSGCNVVAKVIRPEATRTIVVSSHLDSVRNQGADDNASGTAALLELVRIFSASPIPLNLVLVAFDQEELGLVGSSRMAREIGATVPGRFVGNINTDMIAYDSDGDGAFHLIDCGRKDSSWLTETAQTAVSTWGLALDVKPDCTNRSDHASFWKEGFPALLVSENFFGGDANRCYHEKCDRMNLINEDYYVQIVGLLHGTVRLIAESAEQVALANRRAPAMHVIRSIHSISASKR